MEALLVPVALREKLNDRASDGLVTMFTEAHRMGTEQLDRRIVEVTASFEQRLAGEASQLRLDMAALKFDLLKWNFLFWIGQLAAFTAILGAMLEGLR